MTTLSVILLYLLGDYYGKGDGLVPAAHVQDHHENIFFIRFKLLDLHLMP